MVSQIRFSEVLFVILFGLFTFHPVLSFWEYAVTTKDGIVFFNKTWHVQTTAAHQFKEINAIAYDEIHDKLYFHGVNDKDRGIFSLHLSIEDDNHKIYKLLPNFTASGSINGLAFDVLNRDLYFTWANDKNSSIFKMPVDNPTLSDVVKVLFFANEEKKLAGITIDECHRKLYYTDKYYGTSDIRRASLDGTTEFKRHEDVNTPRGIVFDHYTENIYWAERKDGTDFIIEKSDLNLKSENTPFYRGINQEPQGIAVDEDYIYWTDMNDKIVYKINKSNPDRRLKVHEFKTQPGDIIVKSNFLKYTGNNTHCKDVVTSVSKKEFVPVPLPNKTEEVVLCLNDGLLNPNNKKCQCKPEFQGKYCEISLCKNLCMNGSCRIENNKPKCICEAGFTGARCQINVCDGHCLNKGVCNVTESREPTCQCPRGFEGMRCEIDLCEGFCLNNGTCHVDEDNKPVCSCKNEFSGPHCEQSLCFEHCLNNGKCQLNSLNQPMCECDKGYEGDRCEITNDHASICFQYCLNDGHCSVEDGGAKCECPEGYGGNRCDKPCADFCMHEGKCQINKGDRVCDCTNLYFGKRCEIHNKNEICRAYSEDESLTIPSIDNITLYCGGHNINNNNSRLSIEDNKHIDSYSCKNSFNKTLVFTSLSFTVSLAIICIIIVLVRRIHKPLRPRITKKMVVKNLTPLTSRPQTQCEITIEDCCNMNICETPCFDTKLLQKPSRKKESDMVNLMDDVESISGTYKHVDQ